MNRGNLLNILTVQLVSLRSYFMMRFFVVLGLAFFIFGCGTEDQPEEIPSLPVEEKDESSRTPPYHALGEMIRRMKVRIL